MAETSGMAEIRGIDIDKLAKGFADEEFIFKRFLTNATASAREVRWYKRTTGNLSPNAPQSLTSASRARPTVLERSWTRQTSYVKSYFVESPTISEEDIKDTDIDILAGNIRALVQAISSKVDADIFNVISEDQSPSDLNTFATTAVGGDQWDGTSQDPIKDLMRAKRLIRQNNYNPEGGVALMDTLAHESLLVWLISTKGSSIPAFSSEKVVSGVVMELLGLKIVVSENVVTDNVLVFVPQRLATWKSFKGLTTRAIEEPLIGTKIRVKEEGIAILTDPKAGCLITDINT